MVSDNNFYITPDSPLVYLLYRHPYIHITLLLCTLERMQSVSLVSLVNLGSLTSHCWLDLAPNNCKAIPVIVAMSQHGILYFSSLITHFIITE